MKTEGKQSKNNFMLMKTWQGEKGEKMRRDLKYKTAQKASAMHAWGNICVLPATVLAELQVLEKAQETGMVLSEGGLFYGYLLTVLRNQQLYFFIILTAKIYFTPLCIFFLFLNYCCSQPVALSTCNAPGTSLTSASPLPARIFSADISLEFSSSFSSKHQRNLPEAHAHLLEGCLRVKRWSLMPGASLPPSTSNGNTCHLLVAMKVLNESNFMRGSTIITN